MQPALPETLVPRRAAHQGLTLTGTLSAASLTRLGEAFELGESVQVELQFSQLDENRVQLAGKVETTVRLHCQRCLEWFETPLAAAVDVEFGPDRVGLDVDRELVAGVDEPFVLADFVEDELLLSAPMVSIHPESACIPPGNVQVTESAGAVRRPFGELGSLLGRREPD